MAQNKNGSFGVRVGKGAKKLFQGGSQLITFGILCIIAAWLCGLGVPKQSFSIEEKENEKFELNEDSLTRWQQFLNITNGVLINTGCSLIAAGFIVFSIERSNQAEIDAQRQQLLDEIKDQVNNEIDDLVNASQDSIIFSLVPNKNVFSQLTNHVLRQDFIILEHQTRLSFEWKQVQTSEKLFVQTHTEYSVKNISQYDNTFEVKLLLGNISSEPEYQSKITKYTINDFDNLPEVAQRIDDKISASNGTAVGFEHDVDITKDAQIFINLEYSSYLNSTERGNIPFVLSRIADGMTLEVTKCPENLNIDCFAFHSGDNFKQPDLTSSVPKLIWKIKTGLLPYQGIYLFWEKVTKP